MGYSLPLSVLAPYYCPMDIRFWLRRAKKTGLAGTVYCTLTINGVPGRPFTTGISAWPPPLAGTKPTRPRQWQLAPVQRLYGDAADVRADNDTLATLYGSLTRIHNQLLASGGHSSPTAVVEALRHDGQAVPTLAAAAALFLEQVAQQVRPVTAPAWEKGGYAPHTAAKYRSRLGLMTEYLHSIRSPDMPLHRFTAKHAEGLLNMLRNRPGAPGRTAGRARGKCGAAYARKVTGLVSQVLDYAVNQEWITANPLASYSAPNGFEKPLVYLWLEQVSQLERHVFSSTYLQRCADTFLFSCWTGLAWSDLDQFDASRHITANGWLEMLRHKTGVEFSFPLLPGAARLLAKYQSTGLPRYENAPLNRALKEIAAMLDWEMELTHHVARRTFGMYLLNEDVPMETVSAVLGHKNVRTTQKHYARFIEKRKVARDMDALKKRLGN